MGNGLTAYAAVQLARVFRDGTLAGMSDRQVLERFIEHRDETAFEAILYRHGAMVRNVCRQVLFDPHDVDDAVQSVFLVLVRKARLPGAWLRGQGRIEGGAARENGRAARCLRRVTPRLKMRSSYPASFTMSWDGCRSVCGHRWFCATWKA
jgi:Sigma-70 region 2